MAKTPTIRALLAKAHLAWKRHFQDRLAPHDITLKQAYLLQKLADADYLYPSRIAELLFCDRPTVSVVVANMEEQGWVQRRRDPDDARRTRVSITGEGREKYRSIAGALEEGEGPGFDPLACFDNGEIDALEGLLRRLHDHLQEIDEAR